MMLSTVSSNGFTGGFVGVCANVNCASRERAQSEVTSLRKDLIRMIIRTRATRGQFITCVFEIKTRPACEAGGILVAAGVSPRICHPKNHRARKAADRGNGVLSPAS